jgi:hypothetical protein
MIKIKNKKTGGIKNRYRILYDPLNNLKYFIKYEDKKCICEEIQHF